MNQQMTPLANIDEGSPNTTVKKSQMTALSQLEQRHKNDGMSEYRAHFVDTLRADCLEGPLDPLNFLL